MYGLGLNCGLAAPLPSLLNLLRKVYYISMSRHSCTFHYKIIQFSNSNKGESAQNTLL